MRDSGLPRRTDGRRAATRVDTRDMTRGRRVGTMPSGCRVSLRFMITLPLCSQYRKPKCRSFFLAERFPSFALLRSSRDVYLRSLSVRMPSPVGLILFFPSTTKHFPRSRWLAG